MGVTHCAWYVMLTNLFCRFMQAALELVTTFFNVVQHEEAFHGPVVQDFVEFDSD
jgi:hypothetical protein